MAISVKKEKYVFLKKNKLQKHCQSANVITSKPVAYFNRIEKMMGG